MVKNPPASAGEARVVDSAPGSGRAPGIGNGNPLQYACLENSMDREVWWATVHGVAKSRTQLNTHNTHTQWVRFRFSSQWTQHFREICSESWPISLFTEVWWANWCKTVLKTSCSDIKNLALILYTLCYKIQFALQYIINVHNKWLSDSYWIRAWRYFSWSQILGDYFKVRRREKSHITLLKTGY